MSTSRLSLQICLCEAMKHLNESSFVDVIRLQQQHLGYNDLNGFMIKIIMEMTKNCPMESLKNLEKEVNDLVNNNKHVRSVNKQTTKTTNHNNNNNKLFPLHSLPIDF